MGEQERDFKGVWIPKTIWLDDRLSALDKVIFTEIDSLSSTNKGCYASNKYIASFCQCSETKVSKAISKLIDLGYLYVQKFDGRQRILQVCLVKSASLPSKKYKADSQKVQAINIDNNIVINKDNKKNKKKKDFSFILESYSTDEEILSLLNDWLDNRKSKHLAMTEHSIKLNLNKLDNLASESNMSVKDYLTEVVCRGWGSFFVINNYGNNQVKSKNDGWCFNPDEEDDLDFIK